jgi:hypothetical protein
MSKDLHTQGLLQYDPHRAFPYGAYGEAKPLRIGGEIVAKVYQRGEEETVANARRLAATWNACDGIPTGALECQAKKELTQKLVESHQALIQALEPFANYACDPPCGCNNCRARAVVAKAKEVF